MDICLLEFVTRSYQGQSADFLPLPETDLSDIMVFIGWCIALSATVSDTRIYERGGMAPDEAISTSS